MFLRTPAANPALTGYKVSSRSVCIVLINSRNKLQLFITVKINRIVLDGTKKKAIIFVSLSLPELTFKLHLHVD